MKLPRDISGADLISVLCKHFGYARINQQGSHVILQTESPLHHRIAVPNHDFLRIGTFEFNSSSSGVRPGYRQTRNSKVSIARS